MTKDYYPTGDGGFDTEPTDYWKSKRHERYEQLYRTSGIGGIGVGPDFEPDEDLLASYTPPPRKEPELKPYEKFFPIGSHKVFDFHDWADRLPDFLEVYSHPTKEDSSDRIYFHARNDGSVEIETWNLTACIVPKGAQLHISDGWDGLTLHIFEKGENIYSELFTIHCALCDTSLPCNGWRYGYCKRYPLLKNPSKREYEEAKKKYNENVANAIKQDLDNKWVEYNSEKWLKEMYGDVLRRLPFSCMDEKTQKKIKKELSAVKNKLLEVKNKLYCRNLYTFGLVDNAEELGVKFYWNYREICFTPVKDGEFYKVHLKGDVESSFGVLIPRKGGITFTGHTLEFTPRDKSVFTIPCKIKIGGLMMEVEEPW